MVGATLFHRRKHSWPPEEFINRSTLQLLDFDSAAPPPHAWWRRLNCHVNILKEFTITFREAIKMKAPIDHFTRENCKPSASQGVPLGGMGSGSISRGFRGEFKQWQITPGMCDPSPMMSNQFSVNLEEEDTSSLCDQRLPLVIGLLRKVLRDIAFQSKALELCARLWPRITRSNSK